MDRLAVAIIAVTGAVVGALTVAVGLPTASELTAWGVAALVWAGVVVWRSPGSPVATASVGGVLAGAAAAVVQLGAFDAYVAHNPWYAEELAGGRAAAAAPVLLQALLGGLVLGALAAVLSMAGHMAWARARQGRR